MRRVAELWLERVEREVANGSLSPQTLRTYTSTVNNWVKEQIGQLQAQEVTTAVCEDAILTARNDASYETAKLVKTSLSGMCQLLVSHGV